MPLNCKQTNKQAVSRPDILDSCNFDYVSVGSIRLRGIVGSPVDANLIKLQIHSAERPLRKTVSCL